MSRAAYQRALRARYRALGKRYVSGRSKAEQAKQSVDVVDPEDYAHPSSDVRLGV